MQELCGFIFGLYCRDKGMDQNNNNKRNKRNKRNIKNKKGHCVDDTSENEKCLELEDLKLLVCARSMKY